jgi:hypothetical protein
MLFHRTVQAFNTPTFYPTTSSVPRILNRPCNTWQIMCQIDDGRVIFAVKNLLRGKDLFNRMSRGDPLTGAVPPIDPYPDFGDTYSVRTGFISINQSCRKPYTVFATNNINDPNKLWFCISTMIAGGELQTGDILVLKNAKYHVHDDENASLIDFLWNGCYPITGEQLGILVMMLPSELNPMERAWHLLANELDKVPLNVLHSHTHAVVVAAVNIINHFSHHDMYTLYAGTHYLNLR